jgi:nucleoside-diphosphate-sugar epimerase
MRASWQGRRVAVTGATGMTGAVLVQQLLALGAHVRIHLRGDDRRDLARLGGNLEIVRGDLRDPGVCARLLDGMEELIHLASCRRNVAFHHERSGFVARTNVALTVALLEALQSCPGIPVTFFSTANIASPPDTLSLQGQGTVDGYVTGKYACELLWLAAAREHGFPLLILRPVGIYGPGDHFSVDGNVIPSLVVKAEQGGDGLVIWGSGEQERSFLYVDDVAAVLLRFLDRGVLGVQYVSSPERVTVRELATRVRDLVRPGLPLVFDTSRPEGARTLPPYPVHECLGDFPWTGLGTGLRRTVDWWAAGGAPARQAE